MEIIDTDSSKTIETTIFERTLEDMEDKIVEENTGITGVTIIIEVGTDQGRGHSQETMAIIGIDVQVIVDQDQGLELALIEIGQDAIIVGNMIILQGIVSPLEKTET